MSFRVTSWLALFLSFDRDSVLEIREGAEEKRRGFGLPNVSLCASGLKYLPASQKQLIPFITIKGVALC